MLSNHHNKNISSFRIIEPKQFQQAQQIPIPVAQQIPILSVKNPHINTSTKSLPMMYGVNGGGATGMNMGAVAGAPVSYEHPAAYMSNQSSSSANNHQQFQQRTRNLSDTDSSCIPGTFLNKIQINHFNKLLINRNCRKIFIINFLFKSYILINQ